MCQFKSAIIEVSGKCNAKCKWCVTGRDNRYGNFNIKTNMSFQKFKEIYNHLIEIKAIDKNSDLMLYSWGEPFLNSEAMDIFLYLSNEKQSFSVSTNGSTVRAARDINTYKYMSSITFSLPGFSQRSYDRIHGFNFEIIQKNIIYLLDNMRENGFEGRALVVFHVYQFNQSEIEDARKFANNLGAQFLPYYAYFNGLSLVQKFINGMFSKEERKEAQEEICLHYLGKRQKEVPNDFQCPLREILTIDETGNLVLCCAADRQIEGYVLGDIFSFDDVEKINDRLDKAMLENLSCVECHSKKIDAWLTKYERWEN